MKLKTFISNILDENIYLLSNEKNECVVVDPGGTNISSVINYITENNLDLKAILITHGHFDHTKSINAMLNYKKVPVYIGEADADIMYDDAKSMSLAFLGERIDINKDIEIIKIKNKDIIYGLECISTPGHTKGSTCFYDRESKSLFTGDTLFKNAYGRTDFPSGDSRELRDSLNLLFSMDEDIKVYPGHGDSTNIANEKISYYGMFY